jgi:predicted nucleic acid-binding protein
MKVSAALQNVSRLFLDTAPIIYLVEQNPTYLDRVKAIFQAIDDGQISAVTSPVSLAECLVHPIRHNLPQLQRAFVALVVGGANTTFVTINQRTGEEAARLRAQYNVSLPDALQLAAAISEGCDTFLTNDAQLKRMTELRVLAVDDLEV